MNEFDSLLRLNIRQSIKHEKNRIKNEKLETIKEVDENEAATRNLTIK